MAFVNIVTSDRGWILERLAQELKSNLPYVSFGGGVDPKADIQYYVTYSCRKYRISPVEVGYFAHLEAEGEAYDNFFSKARDVDYCVSHAQLYAKILQDHGIENVVAIAPGVDLNEFTTKLRIGVVGRTYHTGRKGEHLVAQLRDIPEIEWHFTGVGWPEPALSLPGEALPDFYRSLDYVLVPALYEGGPMCVVEALACGTPVIGPEVGWVPEFPHVEYQAGDIDSLRNVLLSLIEEKRARRAAVLDRGWDGWVEGHDRLFRKLAAERDWTLDTPVSVSRGPAPQKIGLVMHGSEGKSPGGPTVRVPRLATELSDFGMPASLARHPGSHLADFDLVHTFNVWSPNTALDALRRAKAADSTVIFSPIFLDLSLRDLWQVRLPKIFADAKDITELDRELAIFLEQVQARRADPVPAEAQAGYHASVRAMLAIADHSIFLSERERERLAAIGADVSRGSIVHNPVDSELFSSADPALFQEEFGLKDFVLCVARQESRKNQLMLMHALRGTNIPLVLVGHEADPHYVGLMKRYAEENVHFIPRLPPNSPLLASAFAASRVSVLPSWAEGAPLSALEAAAAGASLVLSDVSGEREYFGDHVLYADPASAISIRDSVLEAYEAERTQGKIKTQKDFIATEYSWDLHRERTMDVYRSVYKPRAEVVSDPVKAVDNAQAVDSAEPAPPAKITSPRSDPIDIVFDVTTSANHKGRWTGIARVEAALALALAESPNVRSIKFVAWQDRVQEFVEMPLQAIRTGTTAGLLAQLGERPPVHSLVVPAGARYVVPGSGWMQNPRYAEGILGFKHRHDLRLTPIIHDVIPHFFPFWFDDGYAEIFERNLKLLLSQADQIVAISEHTRKDVEKFADSNLDLILAPIRTFREGDEIAQIVTSGGETPVQLDELESRPFVLTVGAIHTRKNHRLLYDVWLKLKEAMGRSCPVLVMVGGVAWNGQDLARTIRKDKRVSDVIMILDNVDDVALDWLYRNCQFTVYPSLYEGWGLPVSESLRYGKLCLASNSSSVPEIAPDLIELIDPYDPVRWLAKVRHFATSRWTLSIREQQIRDTYRMTSWREAADELVGEMSRPDEAASWPYPLGTVISLGDFHQGNRVKREGWHLTERWGCWSKAMRARLAFTLSELPPGDLVFVAELQAICPAGSTLDTRVIVNGVPVTTWSLTGGTDFHFVRVPRHLVESLDVQIILENAQIYSIAEVKGNRDQRRVGIGIGKFALADVQYISSVPAYLGFPVGQRSRDIVGRTFTAAGATSEKGLLAGRWRNIPDWGVVPEGWPRLNIRAAQTAVNEDLMVTLALRAVASEERPLSITILVDGTEVSKADFNNDGVSVARFNIPQALRNSSDVIVDIVPSDFRSPSALGLGDGDSPSVLGLLGLKVESKSVPAPVATNMVVPGRLITFSKAGSAALPIGEWHAREGGGVWSTSSAASIIFRFDQPLSSPIKMELNLSAFAPPLETRDIELLANDVPVSILSLGTNIEHVVRFIPADVVGPDGILKLTFRTQALTSPKRLGLGGDARLLGVFMRSAALTPTPVLLPGEVRSFGGAEGDHAESPFLPSGWAEFEKNGRLISDAPATIAFELLPSEVATRVFALVRATIPEYSTPVALEIAGIGSIDRLMLSDEQWKLIALPMLSHGLTEIRLKCAVAYGKAEETGHRLLLGALVNATDEEAARALLEAEGFSDVGELILRDAQVTVIPQLSMNELISFDAFDPESFQTLLGEGWDSLEPEGVWSIGSTADLMLPQHACEGERIIELELRTFGAAIQGAASIKIERGDGSDIPFELANDMFHNLFVPLPYGSGSTLRIIRPYPISPAEAGAGTDNRSLGVMLRRVRVGELLAVDETG